MMTGVTSDPEGAAEISEGPPRALVVAAWILGTLVLVAAAALVIVLVNENSRAASADPRIRVLEQTVHDHPGDLTSRRLLAFAYQRVGLKKQAIRQYDEVLSREPKDQGSMYNSGVLLLASGRESEGAKRLENLLAIAPAHTLAAKALAEHYATNGEYDRLVSVAVAASDAHPEFADLQTLAGLALEKTGKKQEARVRYERALQLVPDLAEAKAGLERLGAAK